MKKIIFSKYSNDRNVRFKIHTDILENESGKRYVRKVGMTEEGKSHLKAMSEKAQKLSELYQGSIFEINACTYDSEGVLELEYVQGKTLEDMLDHWLSRGKKEQFEKLATMYGNAVRKLATEAFEPCTEYYDVFGADAYVPQNALAMSYSNVDMIFPNLIENGEKWIVLDYEWTFAMQVPVDFILYRAINYYQTPDRDREMGDIDLYALLGVDRELTQKFQKMEENFQKFVYAGNTPLWELYGTMGKKYYFPAGMVAAKQMQEMVQAVRFYEDHHVTETISTVSEEHGDMKVEITCEGCNTLRLDPAHTTCIIYVKRVTANTDEGIKELSYGTNGASSDGKLFYFSTTEPQILIGDIQPEYQTVCVEYNIAFVNETMVHYLEEKNQAFNELRCENLKKDQELNQQGMELYQYHAQVDEIRNKNELLESKITSMENSASWKLTKPMRSVKSRIRRDS